MARAKRAKIKDKWRAKKWLVVKAPTAFGGNPVAYIPSTDDKTTIGRVVETTLFDILRQDPQHYSIKLYFKVDSIEGDIAQTVLAMHEYSREYLRSMVRRGSSYIRLIKNYTTRDQAVVRVHTVIFTHNRVNTSKKHAIRHLTNEVITKKMSELTYNQFVQEAVLGKIASDIYNSAKTIHHLRHVGISKTKLIKKPSIIVEETTTPLKPEPITIEPLGTIEEEATTEEEEAIEEAPAESGEGEEETEEEIETIEAEAEEPAAA
ncbi:MAG: 30S ribosomal protein S3ae [Thaumarchaeota archaeon]|nr:30S ribosomal protein S3ae [Nitrososphaerota archaeon]MCL5319159.1 30S ribosomal protein S3ae [Nitrososphaerota archaeon]